jgi:putative transposase
MPRRLRIDLPDAIHHIAALAVSDEHAFRDVDDRHRLLAQLTRVVGVYDWSIHAYCLMGSHFHLLVHTAKANLSIGMQHLCGPYAQWFNWKYDRRGHLFARRFASVHVTQDSHLLEAHRYIALNPVRAGLCADPAEWRWGSFRALAGVESIPDFLDDRTVLDLFASSTRTPRDAFREFVMSGLDDAEADVAPTAGV